MKHILLGSLIALMGMSTLHAASVVTSGDVALSMAPKDGIIVFTYADGWDKFSKKRSDELMADEHIKKALGDAAMLPYPSYDLPTEAHEKKLADLRGKLDVPRVLSYPAMIIFDSKGRYATTIQGRDMTAYTNASVAKLVTKRLAQTKQQSKLLEQAEAAKGAQRAKLLGQAYTMPDMVVPNDVVKQIKAADPKDESGYVRGLETDEWKMSDQVAELKNMKDIRNFVDKVLKDEVYNTKVKQTAIIRMLAQWRTLGTREQIPQMTDYAKQVIKLDPKNYHAQSAQYMIDNWFKSFTMKSGWFAAMMPADDRMVMMEGEIPITEAGTYTITIKHTGGRYALNMTSVTLFDGKKEVAQDAHEGIAGDRPKATVYTLVVPSAVKDARLGFTFNQGKKNWTEGQFILEKVK